MQYGSKRSIESQLKSNQLLKIFATLHLRPNTGCPAYEEALKANGKKYEMINYPGVNHSFHNNTTPRYDDAAAKAAWEKTMAFSKQI